MLWLLNGKIIYYSDGMQKKEKNVYIDIRVKATEYKGRKFKSKWPKISSSTYEDPNISAN